MQFRPTSKHVIWLQKSQKYMDTIFKSTFQSKSYDQKVKILIQQINLAINYMNEAAGIDKILGIDRIALTNSPQGEIYEKWIC